MTSSAIIEALLREVSIDHLRAELASRGEQPETCNLKLEANHFLSEEESFKHSIKEQLKQTMYYHGKHH